MDREDRAEGTSEDDGADVDEASGAEPSRAAAPEDPTDPELAPPSAPMLGRVPPVNRAVARVGRRLGGRPLAVYGVLAAGGAVLLILLLIVWFSAGDNGDDDRIPCFDTAQGEAVRLVKDGQIERVTIVSPQSDGEEVEDDLVLPTFLSLELVDGTCRNLQPQGPSGEFEMYTVLGVVEWYNQKTAQRRITIDIGENSNIPAEVLATVTPVPTPTVPVIETPVAPVSPVAETAVPTATVEATVEATVTPTSPVGVDASPAASPVGSPGV